MDRRQLYIRDTRSTVRRYAIISLPAEGEGSDPHCQSEWYRPILDCIPPAAYIEVTLGRGLDGELNSCCNGQGYFNAWARLCHVTGECCFYTSHRNMSEAATRILSLCPPTRNNTGIGCGPTSGRMDPSTMTDLTGSNLQSRSINYCDEMPVVAKSRRLAHFAKLWRAENNVQYTPKGNW
jgi:hypothetical protein